MKRGKVFETPCPFWLLFRESPPLTVLRFDEVQIRQDSLTEGYECFLIETIDIGTKSYYDGKCPNSDMEVL